MYTLKALHTLEGDNSQAYIPKRHTLIQVLPPANAYTKYAHASYIILVNDLLLRVYVWADNKTIYIKEVPEWVYALWVCKPVNYFK